MCILGCDPGDHQALHSGTAFEKKGSPRDVCELEMCPNFLNHMEKWRWLGNTGLERDCRSSLCGILNFRVQTHQKFLNGDIITIMVFREKI